MGGLGKIKQINSRANQLYDIIRSNTSIIDNEFSLVVDYGAGFGDVAFRLASNHKCRVLALEASEDVFGWLVSRAKAIEIMNKMHIHQVSIESEFTETFLGMLQSAIPNQKIGKVGICFSVLPYLSMPDKQLEKMSKLMDVSFIECQYSGDGPGFSFIEDDDQMKRWLSRYFNTVDRVGSTTVKQGAFDRTVWRCKNVR